MTPSASSPLLAHPKRGLRAPKGMPKGPKIPEEEIQAQAEAYLNIIGVDWFHLPAQILNAAFHSRQMGGAELWAARNASAKIKGFPDLILFYKGFYKAIELKSSTGVLSQHQGRWLNRLGGEIIYSFDGFKIIVDVWKTVCDQRASVLAE